MTTQGSPSGGTIAKCKASDSVLLGAWAVPNGRISRAATVRRRGLLGIRGALGLFANLRPAVIFEPLREASPLKPEIIGEAMDIMVVRELTGGIYFGERGRTKKNGASAAYDTELYTVPEVERIARVAFDLAMKRNKKLCNVDKANVLDSSRLWRKVVEEVARDYPEVTLTHMLVDNCAMQLVMNPGQFDVILTENMFGDIYQTRPA